MAGQEYLLKKPQKHKSSDLQLFNIETDPAERENLADR